MENIPVFVMLDGLNFVLSDQHYELMLDWHRHTCLVGYFEVLVLLFV
jgi:hypothetical protein